MIEVTGLTKYYGDFCAVKDVSFSIGQGEIVGFLGPNGAGKTTTLRTLAGYMPQSSGTVKLLGKDNTQDPLGIKRQVGYLAENNPLYENMEVTEYLAFLWEARALGDAATQAKRVKEMVFACGLSGVIGKDIAELSKGYRQRVGLAGAMLHNPAILLLDEPTSGLDPIQAKEVRDLIKSIKKEKTILLSTHILSEVQMICDRVMIIHRGRLVTDQRVAELQSANEEFILTVTFSKSLNGDGDFQKLQGVTAVEVVGAAGSEHSYKIRASRDLRRDIFEYVTSKRLPLLELRMDRKSLEEIFHELTKEGEK